MTVLHVSQELASRIQAKAEQTHQSVEELLTGWIAETDDQSPKNGSMPLDDEDDDEELVFPEAFAEAIAIAEQTEPISKETDVVARSREILRTEFPAYLEARTKEQIGEA